MKIISNFKLIVFIAWGLVPFYAQAMYYSYNNGVPYELNDFSHFDSVDWSQYQSIVYSNCTMQIIAGRFLLTSGHCVESNTLLSYGEPFYNDWQFQGSYTKVKTATKSLLETLIPTPKVKYSYWNKPNKNKVYYVDSTFVKFSVPSVSSLDFYTFKHDMAIFTLKESYPHVETAKFLNPHFPKEGDVVRGFGAKYLDEGNAIDQRVLRSGSGTLKAFDWVDEGRSINLMRGDEGSALTEPGDSGGMWLNSKNEIVGLTRGGEVISLVADNADFLLESINAWHSVTYADITAGKQKTIELQNLHSNTLDLANTITKTGDIDIDDNQCANVAPFETCQITLSSVNGEAGVVTLEDGFNIYINDVPEHYKHPRTPQTGTDPKKPVQAASQGGGGGGSVGWSLLVLLAVWGIRERFGDDLLSNLSKRNARERA